jgi:hypothetical protein
LTTWCPSITTIGFEVTYRQFRPNDATPVERVPVLVYLAELLVRSGDRGRAADVLAELRALELDDAASAGVAEELAASAAELVAELS